MLKSSSLTTFVFGFIAFGFAAYGLMSDIAPAPTASVNCLDKDQFLDKDEMLDKEQMLDKMDILDKNDFLGVGIL